MFITIALVLFLLFIAVIILLENEEFGWTTFIVALLVGGLVLLVPPLKDFILSHSLSFWLVSFLGYLLTGSVWSIIKWGSFLFKFREACLNTKTKFIKEFNLDSNLPLEDQVRKRVEQDYAHSKAEYEKRNRNDFSIHYYSKIENHYHTLIQAPLVGFYPNIFGKKPLVQENKSRIMAWMAFWPVSVIGTIIDDPLKRLFKLIFRLCKNVYETITNWIFDEKDFK
jgi:hypothetical protein